MMRFYARLILPPVALFIAIMLLIHAQLLLHLLHLLLGLLRLLLLVVGRLLLECGHAVGQARALGLRRRGGHEGRRECCNV